MDRKGSRFRSFKVAVSINDDNGTWNFGNFDNNLALDGTLALR
jgi:hypothetical protein